MATTYERVEKKISVSSSIKPDFVRDVTRVEAEEKLKLEEETVKICEMINCRKYLRNKIAQLSSVQNLTDGTHEDCDLFCKHFFVFGFCC